MFFSRSNHFSVVVVVVVSVVVHSLGLHALCWYCGDSVSNANREISQHTHTPTHTSERYKCSSLETHILFTRRRCVGFIRFVAWHSVDFDRKAFIASVDRRMCVSHLVSTRKLDIPCIWRQKHWNEWMNEWNMLIILFLCGIFLSPICLFMTPCNDAAENGEFNLPLSSSHAHSMINKLTQLLSIWYTHQLVTLQRESDHQANESGRKTQTKRARAREREVEGLGHTHKISNRTTKPNQLQLITI